MRDVTIEGTRNGRIGWQRLYMEVVEKTTQSIDAAAKELTHLSDELPAAHDHYPCTRKAGNRLGSKLAWSKLAWPELVWRRYRSINHAWKDNATTTLGF